MALLVALVAGLLAVAESQASSETGFLSKPSLDQFISPNVNRMPTAQAISTKDFDFPKTAGKEEENTPITMPAIGVGLLALVTMLGVGIRRALQPATVLASSGLGDNIMEMKSQGSDSAPTVGWGSLPSQSSRPLTPSYAYVNPTAQAPVEILTESPAGTKQDFLEASPYWDQKTVPVNTWKNKSPYTAKVVSCKRIVGPEATGETCHIIFDHKGEMPYWEGQSYGVIPDGVNPKNGKNHTVRLYSIASSRYGDDMTGKTSSLCVRRATYWCPEMGKEDPAKKGVCSNFLCDTKAGAEVKMTGPTGKVMLMPEEKADTDYIMVATGTGIAPYRGFIRRLFTETTLAGEAYKGVAWLFLGVANSDALLYDEEWQAVKAKYPDNFKLDYALSREQTNAKGGKMYIQDKVEEYADEIFDRLSKGAVMYFCGLKGMMPGIQDMLKGVCEKKGLDFDEYIAGLKKGGQWRVEVY
jgi:ferredoxin--NADP+ reductase